MKGTSHIWGWGLIAIAIIGLITGLVLWMSQAGNWSISYPANRTSIDSLNTPVSWAPTQQEQSFSLPFSPSLFKDPPSSSKPWMTWHWNPNETSPQSIIPFLSRVHQLGFGGIVIQPTYSLGHNPSGLGFYQQLAVVFRYAETLSLRLMLSFEGLPQSSTLADSIPPISHLVFGEVHVKGHKTIDIPLPKPETPAIYALADQHKAIPSLAYQMDDLRLVHIMATKPKQERRSYAALHLTDQTQLRADSVYLLDPYLDSASQHIRWEALPGDWLIIAIYQLPVGMPQTDPLTGQVQARLNWFSSAATAHSIEALILRDLFSFFPQKPSALEGVVLANEALPAEAFYYEGLVADLKRKWGYDPTPYLPAVLVPGRHNPWYDKLNWLRKSAFTYGNQDQWIRMDYEEMLSKQYQQAHLAAANQLLDSASLSFFSFLPHWDADLLALGESVDGVMLAHKEQGQSELAHKMGISANHLHNNPVSSIQFDLQSHSTLDEYSPQLIQLTVDKLYGLGINDIHYKGNITSTSPLRETEWANLLAYQSRCQFSMQQGDPLVDVGIYYPFSGFPENWGRQHGHQEWMLHGEVPRLTGPIHQGYDDYVSTNHSKALSDARVAWLLQIWPYIQALEKRGLSWNWVNRQALEHMRYPADGAHIILEELPVSLLWIFQPPYLSTKAAQSLAELDEAGAPILYMGEHHIPHVHFNPNPNDISPISEQLGGLSLQYDSLSLADFDQVLDNVSFTQAAAFHKPYSFLGRAGRTLPGGDQLHFFHNKLAGDRKFVLDIHPDWPYAYWLNPHNGHIHPAQTVGPHVISGFLGSYDAAILWIRQEPLANDELAGPDFTRANPFTLQFIRKRTLNNWTWVIPQASNFQPLSLEDTSIFSWWDLPKEAGIPKDVQYIASFELSDTSQSIAYVLDLGMVNGKVDIRLNTREIGSLYQCPYRLDVSEAVEPGMNILEMWVKAAGLPKGWQQLPISQRPILGLQGPVQFWEIRRPNAIPLLAEEEAP